MFSWICREVLWCRCDWVSETHGSVSRIRYSLPESCIPKKNSTNLPAGLGFSGAPKHKLSGPEFSFSGGRWNGLFLFFTRIASLDYFWIFFGLFLDDPKIIQRKSKKNPNDRFCDQVLMAKKIQTKSKASPEPRAPTASLPSRGASARPCADVSRNLKFVALCWATLENKNAKKIQRNYTDF